MELTDTLELDAHDRTLDDKAFTSKVFTDFTLRPAVSSTFTLRGVKFEDRRVTPGTCVMGAGTVLEDVLFRNFQCGDAMHIAAEVVMRDVVIEGKEAPKMLWIKPSENVTAASLVPVGGVCSLDITGYDGELSVTGIDIKRVRTNPQLHIRISLEKMNGVDWESLGIGGLSYWRLMARKISADGATEGIFSLPPKKGRNYEKSMAELERLQDAAII